MFAVSRKEFADRPNQEPNLADRITAMTEQLRRILSLRDLIFITVGTVIGSGIFLTPGAVVRDAGSGAVALAAWIAGGVLSLLGALTFAELGALSPDSGGLYTYVRQAFGPLPAFLYGWTMFLVIGSGTLAAHGKALTCKG